jgi:tetratricopeptide (TPR) repeat protein
MRTLSRTRPLSLIFQTILIILPLHAINPCHAQQPTQPEFLDKPELLRRVALYEGAIQRAEAAHSTSEKLPQAYLSLGSMYEDLGMYPRAEAAMQHGITLLQNAPDSERAAATSDLAMLYLTAGKLPQAEKEELDALQLREKVGEPTAIAESWSELASIYLQQRQYKKSEQLAQKAMDAFSRNSHTEPIDQIGVRFNIARALCAQRQCSHAIPLLKDAIELAKTTFGANGLPVGYGNYLLGYSYWKSGDTDNAADYLQRGTTRMKVELGWGHPIYLDALKQYSSFLQEHGQTDAALAIDRERHQAESVVDARTLTTTPGMLGLAGLR